MGEICSSDLVYLIVPNYCVNPCSDYFAFIERSDGYFQMDRQKQAQNVSVPKRFIIVINIEGSETVMQRQTKDTPVCLYLKSRKYGKKSIAGDILESADAKADLDTFLAENSLGMFS